MQRSGVLCINYGASTAAHSESTASVYQPWVVVVRPVQEHISSCAGANLILCRCDHPVQDTVQEQIDHQYGAAIISRPTHSCRASPLVSNRCMSTVLRIVFSGILMCQGNIRSLKVILIMIGSPLFIYQPIHKSNWKYRTPVLKIFNI